MADDWGRFEYDPTRIWSKVFGARTDVTLAEVTAWLGEYEREGLLRRYEQEGEELAVWTNFHGRPASQRRPSSYPSPDPSPQQQDKPTPREDLGDALQDKDQIRSDQIRSENNPPTPRGGVRQVFEHWRGVMGHEDAKLTEKRERLVKARLKHYTVEQLKAAVDGCKVTPFNMGANRDGQVYDDLELICRDGEHVERFMRNARNGITALALPESRAAPVGKKTRAIVESSKAFLAGKTGGEGGAGPKGV